MTSSDLQHLFVLTLRRFVLVWIPRYCKQIEMADSLLAACAGAMLAL